MFLKTISAIILIACTLYGNTQAVVKLNDTAYPEKIQTINKYLPFVNGRLLYKVHAMEQKEVLLQLSVFLKETTSLSAIAQLDVSYFYRNLLSEYNLYYGSDSVKFTEFNEFSSKITPQTPGFVNKIDSAYKQVYNKRLSITEKKLADSLTFENGDMNNWELFQVSASYRKWLDQKITRIISQNYQSDTRARTNKYLIRLKLFNNEFKDGPLKEYYTFTTVETIIKTVKDTAAINTAYKDFMNADVSAAYKNALTKVYNNYVQFSENKSAPDFAYKNVNNAIVTLKELSGNYVYIDVWATWCAPCKAEIPHLQKTAGLFKDKKIKFVSISVDKPADQKRWVDYVKKNNLEGIQLITENAFDSDFIKKFNINSIPRFILISPAGKIISPNALRPSNPELTAMLNQLLL